MSARWLAPLSVLSGLCGLAYEVLWARMLGLQFGASNLAAVVTVSAFMLGLAAGSAFMTERAARRARPLRLLALLEAGIALFALLLPWGVRISGPLIDAAAGSLPAAAWQALMLLSGVVLLTLPAAAMGAGFPLLVEGWRRQGLALGSAYGSNTLGAAMGALLPLALLPTVGWTMATRGVGLLNLLAAAALYALDGRLGAASALRVPEVGVPDSPQHRAPARTLLLAYAVIGAASLMLELAWLRLFSLAMLRTEYVLALILAVMLLGMGAGSAIAARRAHARVLAVLPWFASGAALAGLRLLPAVSAWLERTSFGSLGAALAMQGLLLAALTLSVTLSLGAWLPALAARFDASGPKLYAANAFGAALGGGLYVGLLPAIGSAGALAAAAVLLLSSGLVLARARRAWLGVPLMIAAAGWVGVLPPVRDFLPRAMAGSRDLYRYEDAIAITQVVEQADGQRVLLTDLRRQDASSEPTAVFVQMNQARLPLLLHPHPRSVLFLGVGTGISLAGSLPFPGLERSAVELSAGSLEAARRWFTEVNHAVLGQTRVSRDDARHFLAATTERYDVIVGDVFHPDLAGMGSLLAVEQFERVRARLAPRGLYVQWLALNQFDRQSLGIVLRSFATVFPQAEMFLDGLHLALVGMQGGGPLAAGLEEHLKSLSEDQRRLVTAEEGDYEWLGRYFGPVAPSAGPVQRESAPVIEFLLPRLPYGPDRAMGEVLGGLLSERPGILQAAAALGVSSAQHEGFRRAYIGTELMVRSELANWRGHTLEADRLLGLAHEADPHDRWIAFALSDRLLGNSNEAVKRGLDPEQFLRRILDIDPWSLEAWRALWKLQRARGEPDASASRARMLDLSAYDREARTGGN